MLVSFSVSNFLSFKDKQTISMNAGLVRKKSDRIYKDKSGNRLVKFAAIYGANASGKSNIIEAFAFSRAMIVHGLPSGSTKMYCRTSDENKNKSTVFEYVLLFGNQKIKYCVTLNLDRHCIETEELKEICKSEEKRIFFRDVTSQETFIREFKNSDLNRRLEMYISDTKSEKQVLFLKLLNQNKADLYATYSEAAIFKTLFSWFDKNLSVNFPDTMISDYSYFLEKDKKEVVSKVLCGYGTGIVDFSIEDNTKEMINSKIPEDLLNKIVSKLQKSKSSGDEEEKDPFVILRAPGEFFIMQMDDEDNIVSKTLQFSHRGSDSKFSIREESDGTNRLMDLLTILLDSRDDSVYVIDEIDRRMHPQLTVKFIMDFLYLAGKRNIQLIVTSHETSLLDFKILRKDEVWFVNKDNSASHIYPLENYPERFDKKIEYSYKDGEYGAIPVLEDIQSSLDYLNDANEK